MRPILPPGGRRKIDSVSFEVAMETAKFRQAGYKESFYIAQS